MGSVGAGVSPVSSFANFTAFTLFDDGNGEALYMTGQQFRVSGDPQIYLCAKWDGTSWDRYRPDALGASDRHRGVG